MSVLINAYENVQEAKHLNTPDRAQCELKSASVCLNSWMQNMMYYKYCNIEEHY